MAKKKPIKKNSEKRPPHHHRTEIKGVCLCFLGIAILLSLASFSINPPHTQNVFGAIGHAIGWIFTVFLGLSSYLIALYLGFIGFRLIFNKPIENMILKGIYFALGVVSTSILLSLIEDTQPVFTQWVHHSFYHNALEKKLRYHLGGAPFYYIYHDLATFNLKYILNSLGVAIFFSSTLLISILLILKVSPFVLIAKIAKQTKSLFQWIIESVRSIYPKEFFPNEEIIGGKVTTKPLSNSLPKEPLKKESLPFKQELKQEDSDFLRYVKLRIPESANANMNSESSSSSPPQNEMLAIHPESNPKDRPSLSRKEKNSLTQFEEIIPLAIKPQESKSQESRANENKSQESKSQESKSIEKALPLSAAAPVPMPEPTTPAVPSPRQRREAAISAQRVHNGDFSDYKLPSLSLLTNAKKTDHSSLKKDLRHKAEVLEETLFSFGIEAKVGQINCGPTITSFEVHPAIGVKVQKIKTLENDIALNMEAKSIRIIAPIPGKAAVGIEVPNAQPEEVGFKEMLAAYQQGSRKFHIPILLGKAVNGEYVMSDLTKMPHCIIAGATGSGKSVCINTIIMSIVLNAKPDEVKLVMVDPKKVELTPYSRLPHMLAPVITEPQGACSALNWLVKEMEKRYELLKQIGARNIDAFNARTIDKKFEEALEVECPERLPFIVCIIDELADLMMVSSSDIETPIARIAQMARAVGIHLILATQRPSREVITGLIKANFPTRISFKVSSRVNSMIILDDTGAETLLGNGDMLFLPPGSSHLVRAQGAFIRDEDINAVVKAISEQAPPRYLIESFDKIGHIGLNDAEESEPADALYSQALNVVKSTGNASTTFLQRKLKIGYARAASLIDALEQNGVVGPPEGSKPRKVLAARGSNGVVDGVDDVDEELLAADPVMD